MGREEGTRPKFKLRRHAHTNFERLRSRLCNCDTHHTTTQFASQWCENEVRNRPSNSCKTKANRSHLSWRIVFSLGCTTSCTHTPPVTRSGVSPRVCACACRCDEGVQSAPLVLRPPNTRVGRRRRPFVLRLSPRSPLSPPRSAPPLLTQFLAGARAASAWVTAHPVARAAAAWLPTSTLGRAGLLVLLLLLSLAVYAELSTLVARIRTRHIPSPPGYPVLGHVPMLTSEPWIKFATWTAVLGPMYRLVVWDKVFVVVADPDAVKKIFVTDRESFPKDKWSYKYMECVFLGGASRALRPLPTRCSSPPQHLPSPQRHPRRWVGDRGGRALETAAGAAVPRVSFRRVGEAARRV